MGRKRRYAVASVGMWPKAEAHHIKICTVKQTFARSCNLRTSFPILVVGTSMEPMDVRSLSSTQTFIAKWLFPALWISGFGFGTLVMWLRPKPIGSEDPRLQFLVAWIIGTLFLLLGPARLKRVRVDATYIYISNYLRVATIPLANIRDVTENRLLNWHPVRVHFGQPTPFGTSIVFMPRHQWFSLWRSHPVVAELKNLSRPSARSDDWA
jgi:hypothetical protein